MALSHHRVVRGQRLNAQTPPSRPHEHVCKPSRPPQHRKTPWRALEKALGGALFLLRRQLSASNHSTDDCPITAWYGGSVTMLKHRWLERTRIVYSRFVLKMQLPSAVRAVNKCVHSYGTRHNGAFLCSISVHCTHGTDLQAFGLCYEPTLTSKM